MWTQTRFTRYVIFQVPGWVLGTVALLVVQRWFELSQWATSVLFVMWIAKDFVIYPFVRTAYDPAVGTGVERLIGTTGTVEVELTPQGYVRVRGELWRAHLEHGVQPIPKGAQIRVLAARGMTLMVTTDSMSPQTDGIHNDSAYSGKISKGSEIPVANHSNNRHGGEVS